MINLEKKKERGGRKTNLDVRQKAKKQENSSDSDCIDLEPNERRRLKSQSDCSTI